MGKGSPQRRGLNSAIVDGGGPLNIFGGIPTIATDYSPMWDHQTWEEWTREGDPKKGYRSRLTGISDPGFCKARLDYWSE